jgi:putative ABC transport system permease protein
MRMALGARGRDVVGMVLSGTSANVGAGLLVGVAPSLVVDNGASEWVTESSRDPLMLGGVTALLLTVAIVACVAPACRAASIDPMDAVRHEWRRAKNAASRSMRQPRRFRPLFGNVARGTV